VIHYSGWSYVPFPIFHIEILHDLGLLNFSGSLETYTDNDNMNHATADGTINNQADENILGGGLLPDQAEVFKDLTHGTCTDKEQFQLSLLHLRRKIQAPKSWSWWKHWY
jgi:hypothetical protein